MKAERHKASRQVAVAFAAVAALLVCSPGARGGVILGVHDWENGAEGWQSLEGWTTLEDPSAQNWLSITFPQTTEPEAAQDEWYDIVYVDAQDLFAGTWSTDQFVRFDFWAEDVLPGALQIQWSSSTNSDIWATTVGTAASTGSWTTMTAWLGNWEDWMFPGATEDLYLADLSTIDWIGLYVYRTGAEEQTYAIDNFSLMIPEPTQLVMLASALTASLFSLRRRKRDASRPPGEGPAPPA